MRDMAIIAATLVLSLSVHYMCNPVSAQSFNRRGGNRAGQDQGRRGGADDEDLEAPVAMNRFPGVGSIDAWRTSVPEFRAGMDKMRKRSWDEAIAHFRASIALYEFQPNAWLQVGRCIEKKSGLISDAETAYRHCLKLDNQNWNGWKRLGNVLYMEKKYDEARQSISNAINLGPPPKQRQAMGKMIQMIDAGLVDANTRSMNTGE